ncbi:MAG: hypothetical protein ACYCYK_12380 [Candidatus Dormibacteria bacterium]
MPASAYKTSAWNSISRAKVEAARPVLVPLIGEEAFSYAQRPPYLVKYGSGAFVVGCGAAIGLSVTEGPLSMAFGAVGWTIGTAFCLGLPLMFHWMFKTSRLANAKLSADLGFPIKVRGGGGGIDPQDWARAIERAKQRYWQEHPEAQLGGDGTDGADG